MWYEEKRWRDRLLAEQAIMDDRFPQFVLQRGAKSCLGWEGILEPLSGVPFLVSLTYPKRYPYNMPALRVVDPPVQPRAPHVYADGSVCAHKKKWNPTTGTAASCVPLLSAWLVAYLHWLETGERF